MTTRTRGPSRAHVDGITLWPIEQLTPYANNARTHTDAQIGELAAAIRTLGLAGVIVVRGRTIAKGHGTFAACQRIIAEGGRIFPVPGEAAGAIPYPAGLLPVQDASGWTEAAFRAFVLADNQLAMRSGWDTQLLTAELEAIARVDIDLASLTGFDIGDIEAQVTAALAGTNRTDGVPKTSGEGESPPPVGTDPEQDPQDAPADSGRGPLVYQVIVDMDQATKRVFLKRKRLYPNTTAYFRAAIEREAMESSDETAETEA